MNISLYARPVMDHQIENTAPGIALVAHDACKQEMIEWARVHRETLSSHMLCTTGTTGSLIARELDLRVHHYRVVDCASQHTDSLQSRDPRLSQFVTVV